MWNGCYGKEPFDLRLTVLRFLGNLDKIILITMIGTLLFGGGYYVKNVLMRTEQEYSATSIYKVDYVTPPVNSGDYFINEATWNTHVQTESFLAAVQEHAANIKIYDEEGKQAEMFAVSKEELASAISAKLPTDWYMPNTTVVTNDPVKTVWLAAAVERTMVTEFPEYMEEIEAVQVMTPATVAEEVKPDVRPVRAFVLSALLSFFFAAVLFLLKEIGDDSIWLPATLRRRYGLKVLGTINSVELEENISYLLGDKEQIGVCSVDDAVDIAEVIEALQEKAEKNWIPVSALLSCPESSRMLRETDANLLVVQAGSHAGKPLEYVLEYLSQQDCKITAVILWGADEWLIKTYYCFGKAES